jgi:hypothetical protein
LATAEGEGVNAKVTPEQLAVLIADRLVARLEFDYDLLADKLAERWRPPEENPSELVSAKEVAQRIGRSARWVRDHKAELGAIPDGDGPRPRWLFDLAHVERVWASRRL